MYKLIIAVLVLAAVTAAAAAAQTADADAEKAEVIKVIETSIKWCFPEKSRERLYGAVAHDSTYFMFHPGSQATIIGFEAFKQFSERVFMVDECKPLGSTIKNLRVVLSRSGDVAWFSCLLDDWGEWGGEPWNWKDTRWTGVLQKMDGKWVMMQQHFSNAEDAVRAEVMEEIKAKG